MHELHIDGLLQHWTEESYSSLSRLSVCPASSKERPTNMLAKYKFSLDCKQGGLLSTSYETGKCSLNTSWKREDDESYRQTTYTNLSPYVIDLELFALVQLLNSRYYLGKELVILETVYGILGISVRGIRVWGTHLDHLEIWFLNMNIYFRSQSHIPMELCDKDNLKHEGSFFS
jgi:hypothetical protein